MNISRINLNLIVALDALLTESNVTRAADKLFITQSAMSNVLKQLRELFQDELLVKNGRNMVLTLRAEALRPEVKQFLAQAESLLQSSPFDPRTSTRLFIIGMEEYAATILLPSLYEYLEQHAPHIQIHIKNIPLFAEKPLLDEKEIELAIGILNHAAKNMSLAYDILLREKLVCLAKPNHPLFKKKISIKNYLAAKHISFMPADKNTPPIVDHVIKQMGYQRDVALRVSHIMPGVYTLAKTNLIATVPESLAREASEILNFSVQPCEIDFPESTLAQMWHPWTQTDSGNLWLRHAVKEVAQTLKSQ